MIIRGLKLGELLYLIPELTMFKSYYKFSNNHFKEKIPVVANQYKFRKLILRYFILKIKLTSPDAYIFHKLLGKGSFGEVYLASRKTDKELFAIKTLNKDKVFSKNLTRYA